MAAIGQPLDNNGNAVPLAFLVTASTQKLNGAAASAATTAASGVTGYLISAPESFHIEIGATPTATTSSPFIPAGLYDVAVKNLDKVAIIKSAAATAGDVWVTPYGEA